MGHEGTQRGLATAHVHHAADPAAQRAAVAVLSYLIVGFLARFGASRPLGDSGVFFCSLGAILAYVLWFTLFARY